MIVALDSSVLVASLDSSEPFHGKCDALMGESHLHVAAHALVETFSIFTGGRLRYRLSASDTTLLIRESILPAVTTVTLDGPELVSAMGECESRGIRGGAIYDYLHLIAARKAGAKRFFTLNLKDFQAFVRPGDPEILHP